MGNLHCRQRRRRTLGSLACTFLAWRWRCLPQRQLTSNLFSACASGFAAALPAMPQGAELTVSPSSHAPNFSTATLPN